ncbi:MAG: aconitate hydratase AcnA [Nitrospinota bacterium]|nr:MAG: aconitate hydratase AcnA [Nitrospinota bacterium]
MQTPQNPFGARHRLESSAGPVTIFSLGRLEKEGFSSLAHLPFSIKVLLESLLRHCGGRFIREEDVVTLSQWKAQQPEQRELPFLPARVLLQDFTGLPAIVDLAAMRDALARLGGDPSRINPLIPVDLVIDHSVQVDYFGSADALFFNAQREFERNRERYEFLRWGQQAFANFRVVPPSTGIVHQVNLEYLARVVQTRSENGETIAFPDTLLGTDSHTTMINGLGVLGWGVGGIEAEAVMLGQPYYMLTPSVVGVKLTGQLPDGATATDLVLSITQLLRQHGVVGKFVEFFGPGLSSLSLPDRATLANMAPEYGATMGFFPVDDETLRYLRGSGRDQDLIDLVERYTKEQGLFRTDATPDPLYTEMLEFPLERVEPSLAGPRRPQDRVPLREMKQSFCQAMQQAFGRQVAGSQEEVQPVSERQPQRRNLYSASQVRVALDGREVSLTHGAVVIAAITSCTNTSNPSVMLGAGLLAKKAVERGLSVSPHVKTSLAPGSRVVTEYLKSTGLLPYLEALRFHVVGYGCTTCIGNSGPLPESVAQAVREHDLVVAAVLSGNRNFEGRVNPLTRANYLASPPLVVAYALAGTVDIDMEHEPLGHDPNGRPVYLRDIWPTQEEVRKILHRAMDPELFRHQYENVLTGNAEWNALPVPEGELYAWNPASTYVQNPPFFTSMTLEVPPLQDIQGARVLALLGDSVTTDHISPAGAIPVESPAGQYLISLGVSPAEFNSFGSRRGNHEVMMRGTFGNIRLRNRLVDREGGWTIHFPSGETLSVYEAAMRYQAEQIPLLVIAGKEYGTGSSRDWAAKGTALLGVKAVLAESYERIHRSNLVGMGVLPLQFQPGQNAESLGLTGEEEYDIVGIATDLQPRQEVTVRVKKAGGAVQTFTAIARLDSPVEIEYYRHGGILQAVLRQLATA